MLKINTLDKLKSIPIWLWVGFFIISIIGIFIFGLNQEYLNKYWVHLLTYNIIISLVAGFHIFQNIQKLHQQKQQNIVGSKFTLSVVKIIPILTLIPILSFYAFSFQSVQDNLQIANKSVAIFNNSITNEITDIANKTNNYQTRLLLKNDIKILEENYLLFSNRINKQYLQEIVNDLVIDDICQISVFVDDELLIKSKKIQNCKVWNDYQINNEKFFITHKQGYDTFLTTLKLDAIQETNKNMTLVVFYSKNTALSKIVSQINNFKQGVKNANITLNSTIINSQFLLDFSTTILLTLLSILMIVLKMLEKIMLPLNSLSIASKKISAGKYGSLALNNGADSDIKRLINEFNAMSLQIKKSKQELNNQNLYLQTIIKYSAGIITTDKNFKINIANNYALQILELDDSEIKPKFLNKIMKNFDNNCQNWSEVLKFKNKVLDINGVVLENNTAIIGYMLILKDITLMQKTQKLQAWSEVAKTLAHEIKNPLNPILLSAQRLRNKFVPVGDENGIIDKTTNTIITQVSSITNLINAFAEYGKSPDIVLKNEDINKIIKNVSYLYENNCTINLNLAESPNLKLDKNSINQVLINLIKNSIEAKKDDELIINISTKAIKNKVILTIIDNGFGFDKSIIARVFEPKITNKKTGSGLGLAIVEKILTNHNASIKIDENYQNGAKLIITFNYE